MHVSPLASAWSSQYSEQHDAFTFGPVCEDVFGIEGFLPHMYHNMYRRERYIYFAPKISPLSDQATVEGAI